jgi:hypothetical protein
MFKMPVKSRYLDNSGSCAGLRPLSQFTVGCPSLKAARLTSQSAFVRPAAAAGRQIGKEPVRPKSRAGRTRTGRRVALGVCALPTGVLAGLVAYRYGGAPALGPPLHPPFHAPAQSPVIALGAVGLVCYTMFFLVCEAALLVLAIINIQDEKVHNKYKSLMLLVLYVFTFRYRRVLPATFFADDGGEAAPSPPGDEAT